MVNYAEIIAKELSLKINQVQNTLQLINNGATIPFIARYRKEATDSLDEVLISSIKIRYEQLVELEKKRNFILETIESQGVLTDDLSQEIKRAKTINELEDLYLPYKPKRKTKASIAKEQGLEPLADKIKQQTNFNLIAEAQKYINPEKNVNSYEDVLQGARYIIAEQLCEDKAIREKIRIFFEKSAYISSSKVAKKKDNESEKYIIYFDRHELLHKMPSHRILAMFRGEEEGVLKLHIEPEADKAIEIIQKQCIKQHNEVAHEVETASIDAYKRLLQPQMETEMRQLFKIKADQEAIRVFTENLRQLLLAPPLGQKTILAIDPGFRTGCKIVILNQQGQLLHNETIYPHPPQQEYRLASDKLKRLVSQYKVDAIAIGNGTAGRETEDFVKKIPFDRKVIAVVVSESGASIYSASAVAREEFPSYDVTVRGAVSIGRRLMDPLAELVKIDPKSIGVGQYQHDVNQTLLQKSLQETVESCVNQVGVEVNTASKELLSFVSGVGPSLAKNIVNYRNEHGAFTSRNTLKKIPRFGDKSFEQAAGFLRIRDAENPLDSSAVHPESYYVVEKMSKKLNVGIQDLIKEDKLRQQIKLEDFTDESTGLPTLRDIIQELAKPGRDPRAQFDFFEFDNHVHSIEDLEIGMTLPGIITNITAFGCFVDIGIHQDGLVHISQLADKYVSDPNDIVKLHQKVIVKVMDIDILRKRISLSMKGL